MNDVEKIILQNIPSRFDFIIRDDDGLWVYENRPYKHHNFQWYPHIAGGEVLCMKLFNHLFSFIKYEDSDATQISELLKTDTLV